MLSIYKCVPVFNFVFSWWNLITHESSAVTWAVFIIILSEILFRLIPVLTCVASAMWSSCWCSSWLCSTGAAGSWTGGTGCCPPRKPAAGLGSGLVVAACRKWSWCMASGRAEGMGLGWTGACGGAVGTRAEAESPWIPACSRLPRGGGAARNRTRVERCWSGVWRSSSWSTHQVLSLMH